MLLKGSCHCQAVTFSLVSDQPYPYNFCFCSICRKTQGGDWLIIAFLGVVQIGLAYALFTQAIRHVPALEASLLLQVEPVLSPTIVDSA